MKKKKGFLLFAAQALVIAAVVSLILMDAARFFPDYVYEQIGALPEEKEVQAKGTKPKENSKKEEEETPDQEEEQERSSQESEDTSQGPSDTKYKDSSASNTNGTGDQTTDQQKNMDSQMPTTDETPQTNEPVATDEPNFMETPSPTPTQSPSNAPTPTPTLNPTPEAKLESISAKWPDKDKVEYRKEIKTTTLTVTGTKTDGSTISIPVKDCSIVGLESKSLGEHTMIIKYGEFKTTLFYTVIRGSDFTLSYSWDVDRNKGKCILGEDIQDILWVYKVYSDGDYEDVEDYQLTGIDNEKTGKQTGIIQFEGQTKAIVCEFLRRQRSIVTNYYSKDGKLVHSDTDNVMLDDGETPKFQKPDNEVTYNSKKYVVKSTKFVLDGKERTIPYTMRDRDFEAVLTIDYEEV